MKTEILQLAATVVCWFLLWLCGVIGTTCLVIFVARNLMDVKI